MQTKYLSEQERRVGRHHFVLYECWNGVSIGLLGDTFVNILAVRFMAGNLALGYISSALYITSLVIPFVVRFLKGHNIRNLIAITWYLRGFVCLGHLLLLFLKGDAAIFVLLLVYTLYAAFRAVGMVMYDAISKSITTLNNRGAFYARANIAYNGLTLGTKLVAVLVMYFSTLDPILTIVIMQMIGVVGNTIASYEVSRVPCRINFEYSAATSFKETLKMTFKDKRVSSCVMLRWIQLSIIVVMGMNVSFMSRILSLDDSFVILFTVQAMLAYVLSGLVSGVLSDKIGSKPLVIIGSAFFMILSALWFIMPPSVGPVPFFVVGFFSSFSMQLVYLLSTKLTADVIPENNSAMFTVLVNIGMAIFALAAGFFAGGIVNLGYSLNLNNVPYVLNNYSLCFLSATVLSSIVLIIAIRMEEEGATSVGTLFSKHGLMAISTIKHLEASRDPLRHRRLIMDLSENNALIAEEEIKSKLKSPYSRDARDIINTLTLKPSAVFTNDIIDIAINDDSYIQMDAITALKSYTSSKSAEEALLMIMRQSKWSSARSEAACSLSYFPDSSRFLSEVEENIHKVQHIDNVLSYLVALNNMDKEKKLFTHIFDVVVLKKSKVFRATVYSYMDILISDETPRLGRIYERGYLGEKIYETLSSFLEDLRSVEIIDSLVDDIVEAYKSGDVNEEIRLCMEIVNRATFSTLPEDIKTRLFSLKTGLESVKNIDKESLEETDMVALLYFSCLLVCPGTFIFPY